MKKFLLGLLFVLTTAFAYGQKPTNEPSVLITRHLSSNRMVWSNTDNKHLFFDLDERAPENCVWLSYFNDNGTGYIKMIKVSNSVVYDFNIYDYVMKEDDNGQYLRIEAIQTSNGEKVTILVNTYEDDGGWKMVSIFLPESDLALFFDTKSY